MLINRNKFILMINEFSTTSKQNNLVNYKNIKFLLEVEDEVLDFTHNLYNNNHLNVDIDMERVIDISLSFCCNTYPKKYHNRKEISQLYAYLLITFWTVEVFIDESPSEHRKEILSEITNLFKKIWVESTSGLSPSKNKYKIIQYLFKKLKQHTIETIKSAEINSIYESYLNHLDIRKEITEFDQSTSYEEFLRIRASDTGVYTIVSSLFIGIFGFNQYNKNIISKNIHTLSCLHIGLYNDIVTINRDKNEGLPNSVSLYAIENKCSIKDAILSTLERLNDICGLISYEMKESKDQYNLIETLLNGSVKIHFYHSFYQNDLIEISNKYQLVNL